MTEEQKHELTCSECGACNAERDRLREVNADLLAAIDAYFDEDHDSAGHRHIDLSDAHKMLRAAAARARGENVNA